MPKVAFIIASENYQDTEYEVPKKILEEGGVEVVAVSSKEIAKSKYGKTTEVDMLIDDIIGADYDGLVFIGGGGCQEYFTNEKALELAREFAAQEKVLGAICLAPVILGHAGVIGNKMVTCHPGAEEQLKETGQKPVEKDVVVDGMVVTGSGPEAAEKFGKTVLKML